MRIIYNREVDANSGNEVVNDTIINIGNTIIVPSTILTASTNIYRAAKHTDASFYLSHEVIALIERNRLPENFDFNVMDVELIVLPKERRFRVEGIMDLHGESLIEFGLKNLDTGIFR